MIRRITFALGLYALLGGLVSFAGWAFDIPRLADWDNDGICVQPNATLCVFLSGLGVVALAFHQLRVGAAFGLIVLLISGMTLFEWMSGISLGIDTMAMFGREWGREGVLYAGRMGPPGSVSWTLIGAALVLTCCPPRTRRVTPLLVLATVAISALSLIGYLYGASTLYSLPRFTIIALQTSTFIMAVSLGILVNHPEPEPMRTLLDPGNAGLLARRLVTLVLTVPVFLGFMAVKGQRAGFYDTALETAMLVLVLIGFLAIFLWWSISTIQARERREQRAASRLRVSQQGEHDRRQEMEALIQAAPAAIWVAHDPECRVISGNPAAAAMLRMPVDSNMSKTARESDAPKHVEFFRDGRRVEPQELPMQTVARTGLPVPNQELELRFQDGSSKWAYGNAVPLFDREGKVRGVIATFVDSTHLKKAEELLRETDRRKDAFLALLAHELRNPLAPIRNAVQILRQKGPDVPELLWARDVIDRQMQQMSRIIDDLLDLNRISRDMVELKRERVDLEMVIQGAVETSRPLIEQRGHELIVELPPEPVYLNADVTRLAQAFCNLLNNGAKYTEPGGRIVVNAERNGSDIVVMVRDTGVGIPADMLPRVFDMFTQVDGSLEKTLGGLGIGLTLVKRLVEMHGGSVEARSDGPGKGSEFIVRLPVVLEGPQEEVARNTEGWTASRTSHRILIVDDNQDAIDSLGMILRHIGNDIRKTYDGVKAVQVAGEFRPDVVLLDIGLPRMNGYDVARAIRSEEWGRRMVLIAVTGWGQQEDRRRSKEAGFDHHMVKPVDPRALLKLLASLPAAPEEQPSGT